MNFITFLFETIQIKKITEDRKAMNSNLCIIAAKGKDGAGHLRQTSHQHYEKSGEHQQEPSSGCSLKSPTNIYYFKAEQGSTA